MDKREIVRAYRPSQLSPWRRLAGQSNRKPSCDNVHSEAFLSGLYPAAFLSEPGSRAHRGASKRALPRRASLRTWDQQACRTSSIVVSTRLACRYSLLHFPSRGSLGAGTAPTGLEDAPRGYLANLRGAFPTCRMIASLNSCVSPRSRSPVAYSGNILHSSSPLPGRSTSTRRAATVVAVAELPGVDKNDL